MMIKIKYPEFKYKIKNEGEREFIFDRIRKQWIMLTNEEWVRQNFIQFLVQEMKYPESLIAVEKEIQLGELKKRFDILVYNKDHQPWMLIECKAQDVTLDEKVFEQVLRYNIPLPSSCLIITNGHYTFAWKKEGDSLKTLEKLPDWE